mmetsp:Transcript_48296/g.111953  ORF Transcript_48296/g.111953 Transcript_48296/m.111953 type:complete len:206 (-) Transcript_48296:174-791(-)
MTQAAEVHADLVCPACVNPQRRKSQWHRTGAEVRHREELCGGGPPLRVDDRTPQHGGERRSQQQARGRQPAVRQADIELEHAPCGELQPSNAQAAVALRPEQCAGGVAVQTVHQPMLRGRVARYGEIVTEVCGEPGLQCLTGARFRWLRLGLAEADHGCPAWRLPEHADLGPLDKNAGLVAQWLTANQSSFDIPAATVRIASTSR